MLCTIIWQVLPWLINLLWFCSHQISYTTLVNKDLLHLLVCKEPKHLEAYHLSSWAKVHVLQGRPDQSRIWFQTSTENRKNKWLQESTLSTRQKTHVFCAGMPRFLSRSPVARQTLATRQSRSPQDFQTTHHQDILGSVTQKREYPILGLYWQCSNQLLISSSPSNLWSSSSPSGKIVPHPKHQYHGALPEVYCYYKANKRLAI